MEMLIPACRAEPTWAVELDARRCKAQKKQKDPATDAQTLGADPLSVMLPPNTEFAAAGVGERV